MSTSRARTPRARAFGKPRPTARAHAHAPEPRGDAKAVTFAAVLILLTGCVMVFHGDEARIGERGAEDRRILAQLGAAERTLRARGALEAERDGLRARLRRVDLGGDRTAVAARFVRDAAAIAARHRTTIASITAVGPASSAPAFQGPAVPAVSVPPMANEPARPLADTFETIPLDLTVEGRYADVLATIAALSSARVPTVFDVTSLARKQAGSPGATLGAHLRVTLERLAPAPPASVPPRPA